MDLIYYGIISQWEEVEPGTMNELAERISYLGYFYPVQSLSDAGYMPIDLNDAGVPELITSIALAAQEGGSAGLIYDLYTIMDGNVVHLASSGERDRYYLCANQFIANEGSYGEADSVYGFYCLERGADALHLLEMVRYYGMDDPSNPWFYGTTDTYDITEFSNITDEKVQEVVERYAHIPLTLTLFDEYVPDVSADASDSKGE